MYLCLIGSTSALTDDSHVRLYVLATSTNYFHTYSFLIIYLQKMDSASATKGDFVDGVVSAIVSIFKFPGADGKFDHVQAP